MCPPNAWHPNPAPPPELVQHLPAPRLAPSPPRVPVWALAGSGCGWAPFGGGGWWWQLPPHAGTLALTPWVWDHPHWHHGTHPGIMALWGWEHPHWHHGTHSGTVPLRPPTPALCCASNATHVGTTCAKSSSNINPSNYHSWKGGAKVHPVPQGTSFWLGTADATVSHGHKLLTSLLLASTWIWGPSRDWQHQHWHCGTWHHDTHIATLALTHHGSGSTHTGTMTLAP